VNTPIGSDSVAGKTRDVVLTPDAHEPPEAPLVEMTVLVAGGAAGKGFRIMASNNTQMTEKTKKTNNKNNKNKKK
jgi:hypothetical protein